MALELVLFLALFGLVGYLFPRPVSLNGMPFPIRTAIKLAFCTAALWLRGSSWREVGLHRPARWRPTLLLGIGAGVLFQVVSSFLIGPLISQWVGGSKDYSAFANLAGGNVGGLLMWLGVAWTFAAFGEEMVYRGYVMTRVAELAGPTRLGWLTALVVSSALFGLSHAYQGLSGVVSTFVLGLAFGGVYLYTQRNLWAVIVAHGVLDTIGFILLYALMQCCGDGLR